MIRKQVNVISKYYLQEVINEYLYPLGTTSVETDINEVYLLNFARCYDYLYLVEGDDSTSNQLFETNIEANNENRYLNRLINENLENN